MILEFRKVPSARNECILFENGGQKLRWPQYYKYLGIKLSDRDKRYQRAKVSISLKKENVIVQMFKIKTSKKA